MLIKKFNIEEKHCDGNGLVRLSALQHFMQECACEDFDSYGTTGDEMRKNGMSFVITRVSMDIFREIRLGDRVEVFTAHDHSEGVSLIREYVITSQNGYCCRATTVWIVLNLNTRRILRPNAIENYPPTLNLFTQQVEAEKRIFEKDDVTFPAGEILITNEYIDENGHVNNTYYQDFVAKAVSHRYSEKKLSHIQISYVHEAFEGDVIEVSGIFEENEARIKARNGDNICFESMVKFTEKDNG